MMTPVYIFQIDTGRRLAFSDFEIVNQNVTTFKKHIEMSTGVRPTNQVIIVNGGKVCKDDEMLENLFDRGIGTSANPFYIINSDHTSWSEATHCVSEPLQSYQLMKNTLSQLEGTMQSARSMRSHKDIANLYVDLAGSIRSLDKSILSLSENVLSDQHSIFQGWMSLVANLDDFIASINDKCTVVLKKSDIIRQQYDDFRGEESEREATLNDDIKLLQRIPIPSCLVGGKEKILTLESWFRETEQTFESDIQTPCSSMLNSLERLVRTYEEIKNCQRILLVRSTTDTERNTDKVEMRLFQLDQKINISEDLSNAIINLCQNTDDVMTINITLEATRRQQDYMNTAIQHLTTMLTNCGQIILSKEELIAHVRTKIEWMMNLHRDINTLQEKCKLVHTMTKSVGRKYMMLKQVHNAPALYAQACAELLRRIVFKIEFEQWISQLSQLAVDIINKENDERIAWKDRLSRSYLRGMFKSLLDEQSFTVPDYACERPQPFDTSLPQITFDDLRAIKRAAPHLDNALRIREPSIMRRVQMCIFAPDEADSRLRRGSSFIIDDNIHRPSNFHRSETNRGSGQLLASYSSAAFLMEDQSPFQSPIPESSFAKNYAPRDRTSSLTNYAEHRGSFEPLTPLNLPPLSSSNETKTPTMPIAKMRSDQNLVASAPITIPSNNGAKITRTQMIARQTSEKFGTPPEVSSCDAASPPEMISYDMLAQSPQLSRRPIKTSTTTNPIIRSQISETSTLTGHATKLQVFDMSTSTHYNYLSNEIIQTKKEISPILSDLKKELAQLKSDLLFINDKQPWLNAAEQIGKSATDHLTKLTHRIDALNSEIVHLSSSLESKNNEIQMINDKMEMSRVEFETEMDNKQKEIYKQMTIGFELDMDREREQYRDEINKKDALIDTLKSEIDKCHKTIDSLKHEQDVMITKLMGVKTPPGSVSSLSSSPQHVPTISAASWTSSSLSDTATYRDKFELLVSGIKARHQEEMNRMKKEFEYEYRQLEEKYKQEEMLRGSSLELIQPVVSIIEQGTDAPSYSDKDYYSNDVFRPQTIDGLVQTSLVETTDAQMNTSLFDENGIDAYIQTSFNVDENATPDNRPAAVDVDIQTSVTSEQREHTDSIMQTSTVALYSTGMQTSQLIEGENGAAVTSAPLTQLEDTEIENKQDEFNDAVMHADSKYSKECSQMTVSQMTAKDMTISLSTSMIPGYTTQSLDEPSINEEHEDDSDVTAMFVEAVDNIDDMSESKKSVMTQTKVRSRDLQRSVNIYMPQPGDIVAIVKNEASKCYALYCKPNELYAVKSHSATLLGLPALNSIASEMVRFELGDTIIINNLVLARLTRCEMCIIRKERNRYKLPLNKNFFRVEVAPLSNLDIHNLKIAD